MSKIQNLFGVAVAVAMLGLAAGTFTGCEERNDAPTINNETVGEKLEEAGDDMQDAAEDAGDKIKEGAENTKDALKDAANKTGEAIEDAGDKMQN